MTSERFEIKPMFVDEAAMQMDLSSESFKVFLNAQSERVNVIYRRKDGNYGLIEPDF
ncbi:sigma 54 modulation/S30EA ribosomal C-terminal domain-containing protein [Chlamydiota bacterium]